ncbi:cathelicidin-related peptide Oh-Cath-like [Thamnophis elegans]|uniref:cathelicidin-related peptide Oh-Cath-like n=1 Tax=Thamnophis elegans TaxID=35005 RepID=UPI0013779783|nr:cathelicidin-related peptide Oh-Cath-like [Thamnophis elegans]
MFFWKTLLLVGALSASGRSAPSEGPLSFEEAVEQGVDIYNSNPEEDSLYRLLEAVPQPDWDPNSESTQELKFTIKETVCSKEEEGSLDKCNFKEGGVVIECTGEFFLQEKPLVAVLTCEAVDGIEEEEEEEVKEKEKKKNQEEEDQVERGNFAKDGSKARVKKSLTKWVKFLKKIIAKLERPKRGF